jgi:hypothetical protein
MANGSVTSACGRALAPIKLAEELQPRRVSLPAGSDDATAERRGVAVNSLHNNDRGLASWLWRRHVAGEEIE